MPQIPTFENEVVVRPPDAYGASPAQFAAPWKALQEAGEQLGDVAGHFAAEQKAKEAKLEAAARQAKAAEIETTTAKQLREYEFESGKIPDRKAAGADFDQKATAYRKQTLDAIKNDPELSQYVAASFDRQALTASGNVLRDAWGNENEKARGQLLDNMHTNAILAAGAKSDLERGQAIDRQMGAIEGAVHAGRITAEAGERLKKDFKSDVMEASIAHSEAAFRLSGNVQGARDLAQALNDPKNFPEFDPIKREALAERMATLADTLEAKNEAKDREAEALYRGQVMAQQEDNLISIARNGVPVSPVSTLDIMRAYGPLRGPQEIQRLKLANDSYQAQQKTALSNPEQDAATLASLEPKGMGQEDQTRVQDAYKTTLDRKDKALKNDPAAYVLAASPDIAALFAAAAKDPTQTGRAVAALNGAYDQLGLPREQRTVMPEAQAQRMVQAIMADPEHAPAQMKVLQGQYGLAWPQAWHDLVTLGKMPGPYQAVGVLDNERYAALLGRWLATSKGKSAGDLLGETAVKQVKDDARGDQGGMPALLMSLSRSGASEAQLQDVLDGAESLGYALSLFDRDPAAGINAARAFTSKYEYMPQGGARVPRDKYDSVSRTAAGALANLTLDALQVPPIYGTQGNPKPEEFLEQLKANPTWITSPRADSLFLMDHEGRLVRKRGGAPFEVPFDLIHAPSFYAPPAPREADFGAVKGVM